MIRLDPGFVTTLTIELH